MVFVHPHYINQMHIVSFLTVLLSSIPSGLDAVTYYEPGGAKIGSHRVGPITGDCWQESLCKERCLINETLSRFVGSINDMPVCCPFCERSGLYISNSECRCRHNGPDPEYIPTDEELREVKEFKRRINSAPAMTLADNSLTFCLLLFSEIVAFL